MMSTEKMWLLLLLLQTGLAGSAGWRDASSFSTWEPSSKLQLRRVGPIRTTDHRGDLRKYPAGANGLNPRNVKYPTANIHDEQAYENSDPQNGSKYQIHPATDSVDHPTDDKDEYETYYQDEEPAEDPAGNGHDDKLTDDLLLNHHKTSDRHLDYDHPTRDHHSARDHHQARDHHTAKNHHTARDHTAVERPADAEHFFSSPEKHKHHNDRKHKHHRNYRHRKLTEKADESINSDWQSQSSWREHQDKQPRVEHNDGSRYKDGGHVIDSTHHNSRPSAQLHHQRFLYRFGGVPESQHPQNDNKTQMKTGLTNDKVLFDQQSGEDTSKLNRTSLFDLEKSEGHILKEETDSGHIGHISKRASTQASAERAEDQMPLPEGTPEARFNPDGRTPADQLAKNYSLDSRLAYRSPMYVDSRHISLLRASDKPPTNENQSDNTAILDTPPMTHDLDRQTTIESVTLGENEDNEKQTPTQITPGSVADHDAHESGDIPEPNTETNSDSEANKSKETEIELIEPLPEFTMEEDETGIDEEGGEETTQQTEEEYIYEGERDDLPMHHPPHDDTKLDTDDTQMQDKEDIDTHKDNHEDTHKDTLDKADKGDEDYVPTHEESVAAVVSRPHDQPQDYETSRTRVYAQPEPDWVEARRLWGVAWQVHVYGIGVAFVLLALYSLISMLRLCQHKNLLSQGYFLSLNIIMLFLGFFRATYFLVDGYNANSTFHPVGAYFLLNIAYPCLLSAFAIIFLALLQSTRTYFLSPKLQKTKYLVVILASHFVFSIMTDITVGLVVRAEAMMFVSQLLTVLWGLFLFSGYIYIFKKLHMATVWRQKEMMRQILSKIKVHSITPITKQPRLTLSLAIKVMLIAAMIGLMLMAWLIYGMASVYGIFSAKVPSPWSWWGYTFGLRVIELTLCIIICYVGTQPFRYNQNTSEKKWHWSGMFFLAPCHHICCGDDLDLDINDEELDWCELPGDNMGSPGHLNNMAGINQVIINPEEGVPFNQLSSQGVPLTWHDTQINVSSRSCGDKMNSLKRAASRPASLLINDNGFVRFREEGEEGGDLCLSTDDELDAPDATHTSPIEIKQCAIIHTPSTIEQPDITPCPVEEDYPPGSLTDIEEYYSNSYPKSLPLKRKRRRKRSMRISGYSPPGTPASFVSATDCDGASMWSFRPPSSIHLKDSIENILSYRGIDIRTPDYLDSPSGSHNRIGRDRLNKSLHSLGSLTELQSLRDYFIRKFLHQQQPDSADLTQSYEFDDFSIDPIAEDSDAGSLKSACSHYAKSTCDLDTKPSNPRLDLRSHLKVKSQGEDIPFTLDNVCP